MKKNLLRLSMLAILAVFTLSAFAAEGPTVFTSLEYSVDGNILQEGDEVEIGSTISWVAQVTIPNDGSTYSFDFWPLGPKNNNGNPVGWLGSPGNVELAYTATEFTGSFTFTGAQDPGVGTLRMVQKVGTGGNTWDTNEDFSITWVENLTVPDHSINSIVIKDEQGNTIQAGDDIELGSTFSYEVSCTVPDDGSKYEVWVMQWGALDTNPSSITWIKTNKKVITEEAGVQAQTEPVIGDFIVSTTANNNEAVKCVPSSGYFLCRIYKDGSRLSPDIEESFNISWTATTTDIDHGLASKVSVYPNPANEVLNISSPAGGAVEICNVTGTVVKSFIATSQTEKVAISNLNTGVYIVKVTNGGTSVTQKILVK